MLGVRASAQGLGDTAPPTRRTGQAGWGGSEGVGLASPRRTGLRNVHQLENPKTYCLFLKRYSWKIWHHEWGGDQTTRKRFISRTSVNLNLKLRFLLFWLFFFFKVMAKMVQNYGSSERCCRFYFKMRIWRFCRLLFSIKLLKCFGNNNKRPSEIHQ